MFSKKITVALCLTFFSTSCQLSYALLPFSDIYEIKKEKLVLNSTCEDLVEKAENTKFSLKNLAGIRAMARCPDYKYDLSQLSDFEKRLYSQELEDLKNKQSGTSLTESVTTAQLQKNLIQEKSPEVKFSLYKQFNSRFKRNNDRKSYLQSTTEMYKWSLAHYKSTKKKNEAFSFLYESAQIGARAFWTDDNKDTAMLMIDEATSLLEKKYSVAELYFLKARIHDEAKEYEDALKKYDQAMADVQKYNPKTSFTVDRLMWLKAWILYKQKKHSEAETAFAALAAATTDLSEKSRALFYQARCLKNLNRETEAKMLLETVARDDFFGYYGLVSYRELGKKLPALSSIKPEEKIVFDLNLEKISETERRIFIDLITYREYILAEKSISIMSLGNQENELNLAIYYAQKAKKYMPIFRSFSRLDNAAKKDLFLKYPELIFPRPYQTQVDEISAKTNIPASLIYSIMKQESAFNEKARSHADALGLMQVIPRLARQLSKKFEVPFDEDDDLFNPEINIQLGAYELMEQVQKQNGQLTYAAAAYNAGPGALTHWLKNRNREDILEFVEEIPYEETRTYVKLIARNKIFYERISKRDREHDFPPNFLN